MKRTFILMMDSFGIGAAADADKFGDVGANTLGHIAKACAAGEIEAVALSTCQTSTSWVWATRANSPAAPSRPDWKKDVEVIGAYGFAFELPPARTPRPVTGRLPACPSVRVGDIPRPSQQLPAGAAGCHRREGRSARVSRQLPRLRHPGAGRSGRRAHAHRQADPLHLCRLRVPDRRHEETYGLEKLYELCHIVRELLEPYNIGRVIARPFVGSARATSSAPATATTTPCCRRRRPCWTT